MFARVFPSLAFAACSAALPPAPSRPAPPVEPSSTIASSSEHFEFHGGLWLDLHHFLHVAARARMGTRDSQRAAVSGVRQELAALATLPREQRQPFEAALDLYQHTLAPRDVLFDAEMRQLSAAIAAEESHATFAADIDAGIAGALRAAEPAFRALWWGAHDGANRAWVAAMEPLLREHEAALVARVADAWSTAWPAERLRVDVCAYACWAGAYTVVGPTRITIGSFDPDLAGSHGLETLFHEALHGLGSRVPALLEREARARGREVPRDLVHALLFYTAGDAVRRRIPEHVPYADAFGVWRRLEFHDLIERRWRPYLDGTSTLDAALGAIVDEL